MNARAQTELEQIARQCLGVATLTEQRSDREDFHDLHVKSIQRALQAAYEAGRKAATRS